MLPPPPRPVAATVSIWWRKCTMSNDPASGGEQQPAGRASSPTRGATASSSRSSRSSRATGPTRRRPAARRLRPGPSPSRQQTAGQQRYRGLPGRGRAGRLPPQNEAPELLRRPVRLRVQLVRDARRDQGAVHPGPGRDRAGLRRRRDLAASPDSPVTGLVTLVGGAVVALFYVIFFRVILEFYYAVVRMSEDIRAMRNRS